MRAYARLGLDLCRELTGEYAFALWDSRRHHLLVGCDPFLGKAVFCRDHGRVVAARSAREVLERVDIDIELNRTFLVERALFATTPGDETAFCGVRRVCPGTVHVFAKEGDYAHTWWLPRAGPEMQRLPRSQQVASFREEVVRAVNARLPAKGNCAVFLSGGLDSSVVTACARSGTADTGQRVVGISNVLASQDTTSRDERSWAALTAEHLDIGIRFTQPRRSLIDDLDSAFTNAEAFETGLLQNAYFVALSNAARDAGCEVALHGVGGEVAATNQGDAIAADLCRRGRWRDAARLIRMRSAERGQSFVRVALREVLAPHVPARWQDRFHQVRRNQTENLRDLPPVSSGMRSRYPPREPLTMSQDPSLEKEAQRRVRYLRGRLDSSRAWSASGVTISAPLLDWRVIDAALAVDLDLHTYGGLRRGLARRAFEDVLPARVAKRTDKCPFAPDHRDRLRSEADSLRAFVLERRELALVRECVDVEAIDAALTESHTGTSDYARGDAPLVLIGHIGVLLVAFLDWFTRFEQDVLTARKKRTSSFDSPRPRSNGPAAPGRTLQQ